MVEYDLIFRILTSTDLSGNMQTAITYSQDYLDVGNDGIVKRCTSPLKILAVDKNGKLYDVNNHGRKNHLWGSGNNLYDIFLNNTNYLLEVKK